MQTTLEIDGRIIGEELKPFVIAEIGHNHQGSLDKCKELFCRAKKCGVDAVKLQKRDNVSLFTQELYDSPYNNPNSYGATYGLHREYLEFNKDQYFELKKHANDLNLIFFSTAFDISSANFLHDLDMPAYKIASGDLENTPLLKHIAQFGKPIILSTGGGNLDDVRRAYDTIMPINPQLAILQCTAAYPARVDELNLRVIQTYIETFQDVIVGYSGHDNGIVMPVIAYMLGARIIEKHFTLDRTLKGTDHAFSLTPTAMERMVRDLHRTGSALGSRNKSRLEVEGDPLRKMGKKLVASRRLGSGHILEYGDIAVKSPGDGLAPYNIDRLVGSKLLTALEKDAAILLEHLIDVR